MPTNESPITHVFSGKGHEFRVERKISPPFQLLSLSPSPQPQSTIAMPQELTTTTNDTIQPPKYSHIFERPFFDPHKTLYDAHNIAQSSIATTFDELPETLDWIVTQDASFVPTHVLALYHTPTRDIPDDLRKAYLANIMPILAPINYPLFSAKIHADFSELFPDVSSTTTPYTPPVARWDEQTGNQLITLPVVHFDVPHPPSFSLLLLFALGLHTTRAPETSVRSPTTSFSGETAPSSSGTPTTSDTNTPSPHPSLRAEIPPVPPLIPHSVASPTDDVAPPVINFHTTTGLLATYLLPTAAIGEYPAADAMADMLADVEEVESLLAMNAFNKGLWQNCLIIHPTDKEVHDIIRVAFTVTREANRRKEGREKEKERRRELLKLNRRY